MRGPLLRPFSIQNSVLKLLLQPVEGGSPLWFDACAQQGFENFHALAPLKNSGLRQMCMTRFLVRPRRTLENRGSSTCLNLG